jgi:hypothetical protein
MPDELPALIEQLDGDAEPGGVPFDDDIDPDELDDVDRGNGPAYDSAKRLQERNIAYPTATPVGMKALLTYLTTRWGGSSLGIVARPPREMRANTLPSLHNWGIALDWQWHPGGGRKAADAAIDFLLTHAVDLSIQAVHDYQGTRLWKSYAGWRPGTVSTTTGMGQDWARFLHIERTWAAANDPRSIEAALAGSPNESVARAASDDAVSLPTDRMQLGSVGAAVAAMQDYLRRHGFASFSRSDGQFGPRTDAAVRAAQTEFTARGLYTAEIDGIWGPKTSAAARTYAANR